MQPHVRGDIHFGDPSHAGTSAVVQSHKSTTRLLIIIDGREGHLSDIDDHDDSDFVDILPKRQKTSTYFHSPAEEHTKHEYYPT